MLAFDIDGVMVGPGHPPIFLPDIGTFFNQDFALGERMIRGVAKAGCRFLKGEILHRADICLDDDTVESYYGSKEGIVSERYRALIERKVVPLTIVEQQIELAHSLEMSVVYSVYDLEGANFAAKADVAALKIASSNIVHEPLIRHVAGLGLPVILDTGKSSMEEIARAVQWARDAGAEKLIVEHSPDAPPAPLEQHNLRMIETLQRAFCCPIGLSDHHAGFEMMIAATALGVSVLEKGVCSDDAPLDQDVTHALSLNSLESLRNSCLAVHQALGSRMRAASQTQPKPAARMGLIAKQNLEPGDIVSMQSVDFAFPACGIETEHWSLVQGWALRRSVDAGTPIHWCDVEPLAS